jgi:hypothetical protein
LCYCYRATTIDTDHQHTAPHIRTLYFPMQSTYDTWQIGNVLGTNDTGRRSGGEQSVNFTASFFSLVVFSQPVLVSHVKERWTNLGDYWSRDFWKASSRVRRTGPSWTRAPTIVASGMKLWLAEGTMHFFFSRF